MKLETANKNAADLIYLVSKTVKGEKIEPSKCALMDIEGVFDTARTHGMAAIAAVALGEVFKLPPEYSEFKYKAVYSASMFNIERTKILNEFEKNQIFYLPLKGIIIKAYYPKSYMREMADNDIFFDETKADVVKSIMERLGYSCSFFNKSHHDVYTKDSSFVFEMHRSIFSEYSTESLYKYYRNVKDRLIKDKDNGFGFHMTNEDLYIYLICHLNKHYSSGGAGIRFLLDIFVFNNHFDGTLDTAYISSELSSLGLLDFEKSVNSLSKKVFMLEELSDDEYKYLQYFIDSGCYGKNENMINNALKVKGGGSKARYIIGRVFPSKKDLKQGYPLVYRHRALYPLLLLYRPIAAVTKHRKRVFREISSLKKAKIKSNNDKNGN